MAIVFYQKVFEGGISGNSSIYTSPEFDRALARCMLWYVTARATQVTGTGPTITVQLEHSASGLPSEFRSIVTVGKVPIDSKSIPVNTITVAEGSARYSDANTSVPAAYARLSINLANTDNNAHVEVWVVGRDDVG